jgi:hypothetical protein
MKSKTYVSESLKNGRLMRWTFMPLKVFAAPMNFYSKQGEDYKYRRMVRQALDEWQNASKGKISFRIVDKLLESNINIDWKRVERKALGHCYFHYDASHRLYGAEVSIGLTDGIVHQDYMDESEVYHTILHEIGHALGLGHSPYKTDIMYTPHQKGVVKLSEGDKASLQWLYTFPQGKTPAEIASSYGVGGSNLDDVVNKILNKESESEFEKVKSSIKVEERDLLEEAESIGNLRKYHMALQNVQISDDMRKFFLNNKPKR